MGCIENLEYIQGMTTVCRHQRSRRIKADRASEVIEGSAFELGHTVAVGIGGVVAVGVGCHRQWFGMRYYDNFIVIIGIVRRKHRGVLRRRFWW